VLQPFTLLGRWPKDELSRETRGDRLELPSRPAPYLHERDLACLLCDVGDTQAASSERIVPERPLLGLRMWSLEVNMIAFLMSTA
jgi:hypothetical protein